MRSLEKRFQEYALSGLPQERAHALWENYDAYCDYVNSMSHMEFLNWISLAVDDQVAGVE